MLTLFNTYGRTMETFHPVNDKVVTIFTCGPSVYQRAHIGNFRTFLFEDILVRYLEYCGYTVSRGMNFTDVEDKAIEEAKKRGMTVRHMTDENIREFIEEMHALRIKIPDYLARASDAVEAAVEIIEKLLALGTAYRHGKNVYFDPLKFPGFGKLYGLDMSKWPSRKRRFHKDTYPGMMWNRGDFVIWDGCIDIGDVCQETTLGPGRPAWNIQDASIISRHVDETLSIYCGGIDNLIRHHDYSIAILESIRPYPMARYWMHCHHLYVNGHKMSKSKGTVYYTDTLRDRGYDFDDIRFFLIYGHYRKRINYTDKAMRRSSENLKAFRKKVSELELLAEDAVDHEPGPAAMKLREAFAAGMNDDLDVKGAFDGMNNVLSDILTVPMRPEEALGIIKVLRDIDAVFQVIF